MQLPDVETDQLSNSLNGFTLLMEKLSKEKDGTVNEESEPTGEVVGEQTEEEAILLPGSSPLSPAVNNLRSILRDNKFKSTIAAGTHDDYSEEVFRLDGNGEYVEVRISHSICPKKE